MKTLGRRIKAWISLEQADYPLLGLWLLLVGSLEVAGRRSPHDAADLVPVCCLFFAILVSAVRHDRKPVRMISLLQEQARRLSRRLGRFRFEWGLDLRRDPPLPRGMLPHFLWGVAACALLAAAAGLARGAFPSEFRRVLVQTSPTLNALYLLVLWSALGILSAIGIAFPVLILFQGRDARSSGRLRTVMKPSVCGLLILAALVACSLLLAPVAGLWLLLGSGALFAAILFATGSRDLAFLWRVRSHPERIRTASAARVEICVAAMVVLSGATLALLALGDSAGQADLGESMPLTSLFGRVYLWCWLFLFAFYASMTLWSRLLGLLHDPARAVPALVGVDCGEFAADRRRIRRALERSGLRVTFDPEAAGPLAPPLRMTANPPGRFLLAGGAWRREAALDDLEDGDLAGDLHRRIRVLRRRALRRGIRKALKQARTRSYEKGCGYWIAPHLWFVSHLTRDEDEADNLTGYIGPPWRAIIPRGGRHEFHCLMKRLELDLLFVEDGVKPGALDQVISGLFEHDDMKRGQPLRSGDPLPHVRGVRVIVHDHGLGDSLSVAGYPEPDYDEIGRARILHVFRDRGKEESPSPEPVESDSRPVLAIL